MIGKKRERESEGGRDGGTARAARNQTLTHRYTYTHPNQYTHKHTERSREKASGRASERSQSTLAAISLPARPLDGILIPAVIIDLERSHTHTHAQPSTHTRLHATCMRTVADAEHCGAALMAATRKPREKNRFFWMNVF